MNIQQIDEIMRTEFWQEFIGRVIMKKHNVTHSYAKDAILEEKQWLKHVKYQGELDGLDWVLNLPEDIIKETKEGILGR